MAPHLKWGECLPLHYHCLQSMYWILQSSHWIHLWPSSFLCHSLFWIAVLLQVPLLITMIALNILETTTGLTLGPRPFLSFSFLHRPPPDSECIATLRTFIVLTIDLFSEYTFCHIDFWQTSNWDRVIDICLECIPIIWQCDEQERDLHQFGNFRFLCHKVIANWIEKND